MPTLLTYGMFRRPQGTVRFEEGFSASNCNPKAGAGNEPGDGGGIFNGRTGNIVFKGEGLALSDCGYNVRLVLLV